MYNKIAKVISLIVLSSILMGANQHRQTSADPIKKQLLIELPNLTLTVNLDSPGVEYKKTRQGYLKEITFNKLNHMYQITFYPEAVTRNEKIKTVRSFTYLDNALYLDGPTLVYDRSGRLIRESNWKKGKMDGVHRVFNSYGNLKEEKTYRMGLPIGTWRQCYADGTIARKVIYPESEVVWAETKSQGQRSHRKQFKSIGLHSPTKGKEIWFDHSGSKLREKTFAMYLTPDNKVKRNLKNETYFDRSGKVIRQVNWNEGQRTEVSFHKTAGKVTRTVKRYINGKLYRESSERFRSDAALFTP